ncbi:MAG TPA: hypothetical protein VML55_05040 [Planctomycetaceae bacterium]|nr:hypothetical protein [Planctomycetaceae bacterium]
MLHPIVPAPQSPWRRQALRVPPGDESLLTVPRLRDAVAPAQQNCELLDASEANLQGRTLGRLREWTRQLAVRAAAGNGDETTTGRNEQAESGLLFVTGHQPSLFHPGVWAKNFAVHALAQATGGTALNLIIDNDVLANRRIRVPAGDRAAPRVEWAAFDQPLPAQPWEDAVIGDWRLFDSFGERLTEHVAAWGIVPIAAEAWSAARSAAANGAGLCDALSAVRIASERRWGVWNRELRLSRMCESDAFLWFASHLLAHLPRFRDVHNAMLDEYRRVNRLRSRTHPVPELASDGEWLEAPFWVWRAGEPRRRRVFARQAGRCVELFDGEDVFCTLRLRPDMDGCCAVEDLRELASRGVRFRTRALTTTLFARLCLADLFVHGIGGAKYDEMTDRLIARFFGVPAPAFLTLSATLRLPLGEPFDATVEDARRLQRQLREVDSTPGRFVAPDSGPEVAGLIAEQQRLLREQDAVRSSSAGLSRRMRRLRSRENHVRFLRLREIRAALARRASAIRRQLEDESDRVQRQLRANAVLTDRDYSFCLYPEHKLRPFLTTLWDRS